MSTETEYRCPACERWSMWSDGIVASDDNEPDEFWCQICGAQTELDNMEARTR
jgi:DNA-directed RNA polymerase subunit RPC12/RpoP